MTQMNKLEARKAAYHAKCIFAKMLMRVEPCDRTHGYRKGTKHMAAKIQRRINREVVNQALNCRDEPPLHEQARG